MQDAFDKPGLPSLVLEYFRLKAIGGGREGSGNAQRMSYIETSLVYEAQAELKAEARALQSEWRGWIEIRVPGNSPDLKGPFSVSMMRNTLVEALVKRPSAFFTVITTDSDGPLLQDGGEWLVQMEPSQSDLVKSYRAGRDAASNG